jgi:hypothetical protein
MLEMLFRIDTKQNRSFKEQEWKLLFIFLAGIDLLHISRKYYSYSV